MPVRVFTDLDDTVMATGRKIPVHARVREAAVDRTGAPLSYMTREHISLYSSLCTLGAGLPVAVTARSPAGLRRVSIVRNAQAVVDFGATVISADGTLDAAWASHLAARQDTSLERSLYLIRERIAATVTGVQVEVRLADDLLAFITFRSDTQFEYLRACVVTELRVSGVLDAVRLHDTGRDFTVLPRYINKGDAVQYLIQKNEWQSDFLMGCADSLSDVSFLQHMHVAMLPGNARVMETLIHAVQQQSAI